MRKDQIAGDIYKWTDLEMMKQGHVGAEIYRIPLKKGTFITMVKAQVVRMGETIDDEAQLPDVDLQNILQKQSEMLEMMSNVSKVLHETAMAVIKKIG